MRTQTEDDRQAAAATLKEVMHKLEEALRLSRVLRQAQDDKGQAQDDKGQAQDDKGGKGGRGG